MQNFQQILTQAAQLKEHQLKKDRKGYQSLPQFLKSGLGFNKKYEIIRKQHFLYQLRISNKVKEAGNAHFKESRFEQALSNYEEALAIFRYIQSTTYENMKDQNMSYHFYEGDDLPVQLKQKYHIHLCALYLNICSCLTKLNKKDDAIFSADEALKIKKTAKGHYKKAQAYLKYVNRDSNDIKLGILQLKQAYSLQKDPGLINQMIAAKENYEKEQQKSKNWFKFMFDKNKKEEVENKPPEEPADKPKEEAKQKSQKVDKQQQLRKKQLEELERSKQINENEEKQKFEQTKQKLKPYLTYSDEKWEELYQKQFMKRHGSKIYSILKIYKHEDLASEFRLLFAKCLEKEEQKVVKSCRECIEWIKSHPVDQIKKYVERYDLQTSWIRQNRANAQLDSKQILQSVPKQNMVKQEDLDVFNQHKMSQLEQTHEQNEQSQDLSDFRMDGSQKMKIKEQPTSNMEKTAEQEAASVRLSKEEKKKYITVGIILFLLLVRFLWN